MRDWGPVPGATVPAKSAVVVMNTKCRGPILCGHRRTRSQMSAKTMSMSHTERCTPDAVVAAAGAGMRRPMGKMKKNVAVL